MAYKQSNNPIYRKTSPINKVNPYERGLGNTISEDKLDLTSGGTSVHKPSEHNPKLEGQPYPNPDFYERQSDMGEIGADQPDYESDDYKPGMSRNSSSPLNDKKKKKYTDVEYYEAMDKKCPPGHMYLGKSRGCVKIGGRKNKQKQGVSRNSSSSLNDDKSGGSYDPYGDSDPFNTSKPSSVNEVKSEGTSDGGKIEKIEKKPKAKFKPKTAKDAGKVDSSGREGTNRQERKKRRKERKAIRKDKTLSRSQKAMAKKESRKKQKENVRGVKK